MAQNNGGGMWNALYNLFGFRLEDDTPSSNSNPTLPIVTTHEQNPTFAVPYNDDGAVVLQGNGWRAVALDMEGQSRNEVEQINKYREVSQHAEVESAVNDIVNEAIVKDDTGKCVNIVLDNLDIPEFIKEKIKIEFNNVLRLFNFSTYSSDFFRRWYIDGRIFFHLIIDKDKPFEGIKEIRYIDPRKIRKIREVMKSFDRESGLEIIADIKEYYMYSDRGILGVPTNLGTKISTDSVIYVPSGLLDPKNNGVVSYLQKAVKPLNQLRMVEDAMVIYRLARAPERRVFYIDVGNMPTVKANQYVADIMQKYKNKLVYDASTGEVKDDRRVQTMLEDFWLPRREGCFSLDTKVKLLDGRDADIRTLSQEYKEGKQNWTYSVSPTGKIVPGKITWAGTTRKNEPVMKVTLDNGEIITCTLDHKFILRNGEKIEAQYIEPGTSLMPIYTRDKFVTHNRNGKYPQILNNETGRWEFVHRTVAEYFNGPKKKNEVVHHADFTRVNNNPENLVYMDKIEHIQMHSKMGTNSWLNGDVETHKKNLSISGKEFFNTEEGKQRRREISETNKTNINIIEGGINGRAKIKSIRHSDKLTMRKEEYLSKWSKGLSKMQAKNEMIKAAIGSFIDTNFIEFEAEIGSIFHYRLSAKEIINHLAIVHPEWKIGKSTLIKIFAQTPYKTLNSYLSDKYGKGYKWRNSLSAQPSELHNHKVIDVEFTDITMDVGTLTVDGNNDFHDYHNYALSAGIFVMNSRGTEISTLPGGENLGAIDDVEYFQRKLYKALDVPISRLEPQQGFSLGRGAEITRDELKFMKFVDGLRRRFSRMIDEALKTQLILKGVLIEQDWEDFREHIYYDFLKDIAIAELKNQEVWRSRFEMATIVDPFVGKYISAEWVRKQVLQMTDEEIQTIEEEIAEESTNPRFINPMLNGGIGGGPMGLGGGMDGGGMGGPGGPPMMDQNGMPMGGGGGPGGNPFDKLSMGNVPNSMNPNAMNAAPQKGAFPKNNRFQNGKDGLTAANGPKKRLPKIGVKKKLDRTTTSH